MQEQVVAPDAPSESADHVRSSAAARGWTISRSQLERRHRAGVIGRPRQKSLGRGSGTVSIYPPGTAELLVAGLELGGTRMPLRELAFELWLRERPVPIEGVRAYLMATARLHDRLVAVLHMLGFGRAILPVRAIRFVEQLVRAHVSGFLRTIRRRLGSDERVETIVRAGIEMAAGMYTPPTHVHGASDDEGLLVEIVLGIQKGRTEAPIGLQPWLTGSTTEILLDSTRLYAGSWTRDLVDLSDAELERGREGWLELRRFIDVIREMREIFGDDIFGMGALVDGYSLARPIIDAAAVFALARQSRTDSSWHEKYAAIAGVCAQWRREISPQLAGLRALRAFAPTAALFTTRRLRTTLSDAAAKECWEQEARDIGVRYQAEIQRLLDESKVSTPSVASRRRAPFAGT